MHTRIIIGLAVLTFQLSAQVATVNTVSGAWQNALTTGTATIANGYPLSTARWGGPVNNGPQSGYDFNVSPLPPYAAVDDLWFQVGTFSHLNFPVFPPSITGIQLKLGMNFTPTNGVAQSQDFIYSFKHDETPNAGLPVNCPYQPSNPSCADKVTITGQPAQTIFNIGNVQYTLALAFGSAPNATFTEFITQEGVINNANIYAKFTTDVVPEPGFYGVLAVGVSGLFFAVRRRKQ